MTKKNNKCSFAQTAMKASLRKVIKSGKNPLTLKTLNKEEISNLKSILKNIKD